jgi:hypothetical protein
METIEQKSGSARSPTDDISKPVRLTKSGKPDGRSISSKKNLEKGKMKVREILHKAKQSKIPDEEETDDEEFEIISKGRAPCKGQVPYDPYDPTLEVPISKGQAPYHPTLEVPVKEPPISQEGVVGGLPLTYDIEMTKKELQELKKQIQENNLREERRKQLEVQRQVDKIRMEAYGRLNSLSQNMSMKF